jgi:hypothetical protein
MNLTNEQVRAIREGEPVPIVPPEVGEECVVVRRDIYEQVTHTLENDLPTPLAVCPMMRAAEDNEDPEQYNR